MIDVIYSGLQVLGLVTIVFVAAVLYMHFKTWQVEERETRDDEMLDLSQGRKRNNANEIASGNNIRRRDTGDYGERD
jgi:hypothetical protein